MRKRENTNSSLAHKRVGPSSERKRLIAELRRVAALAQRLTYAWLYRQDRSLLLRLRNEFGDLARARKAAGIPPPDPTWKWTQDRISQELRKVHRATGALTVRTIIKAGRRDLAFAIQANGGIVRARRLAGLGGQSLRRRWSRTRVVAELRESARRGVEPSRGLTSACVRVFGGIVAARKVAGLKPRELVWSPERIVAALRDHAARGEHVTHGPLANACIRCFGGIRAARRAAGVPDPSRIQWTRERVIAALQREPMTGTTIGPNERVAVAKLFGSMRAARAAAGVPAPPRRRDTWTAERLINELRRFARKDRKPTHRLYVEARRLFGSMPAARKAAKVKA